MPLPHELEANRNPVVNMSVNMGSPESATIDDVDVSFTEAKIGQIDVDRFGVIRVRLKPSNYKTVTLDEKNLSADDLVIYNNFIAMIKTKAIAA